MIGGGLLVHSAGLFAIAAHGAVGQVRKYTGDPYFVHPERVAMTVASVTSDETAIAAALLHDVVEDTKVSIETIRSVFGATVAALVAEVTDVSRPEDGNRAQRKALDRAHVGKASPLGKTIKLADMIDNTSSITEHDPDFARVYMAEKRLLLGELHGGSPALWYRANDLVTQYYAGTA